MIYNAKMSRQAAVVSFDFPVTPLLPSLAFSPLFPKPPALAAPPSSTAASMSTWLTARRRPLSPPPTPRSPSWPTSARARCPTWSTTRRSWMTPARTPAPRRDRTSSATARIPSTTVPPGSFWWEGWWLAPAFHWGQTSGWGQECWTDVGLIYVIY